ncbi:neuron navigator 3-like, partial [Limulus polyphemus]|uniref:Neuron navigator 3-like n=1 Tax=Limulus polyphemus TaxID=6850 RepID=A0ABM1BA12_LIMPO
MQTESSAFHQMSSSAWKRYTQQSRSAEGTLGHDRVRNRDIEADRSRGRKYLTINRKNDTYNELFDKYSSCDEQKSKQKILTASSEETKQPDLIDHDYSGYQSGKITSHKVSSERLSQHYEDMRKFQSSRSSAVSGLTLGQSKRPASTPSVLSKDRENIYNSRDQGSNSWKKNYFDKVMGGYQINESSRFGSFGGSITSTQSLNIPKTGLLSYKLDAVCKGSKEKTTENVSAYTDTIVNDQYLFGSPTHSDRFETISKNYAFMSSTLSLREPEHRGSRSAVSTPSSDNVMMSWIQPSTKERSPNPPRLSSRIKHGEGDTRNQSFTSIENPCAWIRYSEGATAGSVRSGAISRNLSSDGQIEDEFMKPLSTRVPNQDSPRSSLLLAPISHSAQSLSDRYASTICAYTGGSSSKILNKNDEMHSSSLSLVSTTSSLHLATKEKHAQEISKLKKELDQANEKVANLTTQLTTNAHMVAAFEQSLSNMTDRFQHLTATAEQKDSELGELRNTIEDLKKQSTEAGLTKMALQSMQAVERTMQGKMSRYLSTDSVSSVNSQSSIYSTSSVRYDSADDKGKKKKKGWLRSSFSKAFSRSKKNKNGSVSDVEDLKQFQSDSSTSNTPSLEPYLLHGHFLNSSHSFSALYEKEDECSLELMKDLRKQLREKDMILTDIRLEALTSAHQIESLKDIVNKMKVEMTKLKQDNERLQRLVSCKSLNSSQRSLTSKDIVNSFEKCLSTSENTGPPIVDTYLNDVTSDRAGKKITISAYLCCHGNYCKVKTQHK